MNAIIKTAKGERVVGKWADVRKHLSDGRGCVFVAVGKVHSIDLKGNVVTVGVATDMNAHAGIIRGRE